MLLVVGIGLFELGFRKDGTRIPLTVILFGIGAGIRACKDAVEPDRTAELEAILRVPDPTAVALPIS